MNKKFDVIIIGSGIGGLTAGTYLSKKGLKVLILEKHNIIGGYCTSFSRSFFKFDCGAHLIGSCEEKDSFGNLLNILEIDVDFIRMKPTDRFFFYDMDEIVEVDNNYKNFISFLKDKFDVEKNNIDNFFNEISKTKNPFLIPGLIDKYKDTTYQKFLDIFFSNKKLMGILSAQCGFLGLPPSEASAISSIFMLKMFMIDGAFYPKGGAQVLADSFVAKFKKNGGELLLSTEVKEILTNNGRVKGVKINSGETLYSDWVISNIDCRKTFFELLDVDINKIDPQTSKKLLLFKVGSSSFALFLGLDNKIDIFAKNGWYYPDYDINKNFKELLYIHIPTNYDCSLVKKTGYQVLILYAPFNYEFEKIKDWNKKKNELTKYYLQRLEKVFPGLSQSIIIKEGATPKTFERYTNNTHGALYGWKQIPQQVYLNSFPQESAIGGLYLAGHWTLPGGGIVTVALSGMNAARKILKALNKVI